MNVASLELSKSLYELSGWKNTDYWWRLHKPNGLSKLYTLEEMDGDNYRFRNSPEADRFREENEFFPAFDLGYLVRNLPARILDDKAYYLTFDKTDQDDFIACYGVTNSRGHKEAPSIGNFITIEPEDAVAMLAIKLFKQGVLTRGDS